MIRKQALSFKNAFAGLIWAIKTQTNFKIHLILSLIAVTAGYFLHLSHAEWLVVLTLIAVGLAIEAINTAIEETIDALHKEHSEEIKVAKDVAAAAMLIFAIFSFIIAFIIYIPKLINY